MSSRHETALRVSSIPKVEENFALDATFEDVKLDDDDRNSRRTILNRLVFGQRGLLKKKEGEELQNIKVND